MSLLDHLNPQQREAVLATEGPVLVLAGAGSGKTRVITHRVAHLIAQGVPAAAILSVTFTNKAAEQMRQRVAALLQASGQIAAEPWSGTFHAFCARLLRREAPRLGLRRDFAIYDDDDQLSIVKQALKDQGRDGGGFAPREFLSRISHAKNHGRTPDDLQASAPDLKGRAVAAVFGIYQKQLRRNGAVDFDDLLLLAREVLARHDDARRNWAGRFRHIQVDEYQDTNRIQYDLVRLLSVPPAGAGNLCVVGDEDQSIYSWRGADVGNILRFEEDFPGARVIRLEQNYRSAQSILDAAGAVVANNVRRLGKTLVATRGRGHRLKFFEAADAPAEAEYVAGELQRLLRGELRLSVSVLYRTNFQSRALEEALRARGIRYRVMGGFSFYKRAEVKDTLAYVRLAMNPEDDVAFLRVFNVPPRGNGPKALAALREEAAADGASFWPALCRITERDGSPRSFRGFRALVENLLGEAAVLPPGEFLRHLLDSTGYMTLLEQQDFAEDSSRVENVRELVSAVTEGSARGETLADFCDRAALVSDADDYDEGAQVTLMTLHSAKGLEFDHVFLTGLEEGLFPHSRSAGSDDELEEERRLCYVGMTRARNTLTLTRALYRRVYGNDLSATSEPSRFLAEIPAELMDAEGTPSPATAESRRYVPDPEFEMSEYSRPRFGGARRFPSRSAPSAASISRRSGTGSSDRHDRATAKRNPLVGMRVRHATFGVGTVLAVEDQGDDRTLTISFPDYGAKKLREKFAHLERV